MMLAKGRFWRASTARQTVMLEIQTTSLPEELGELREFRIEVPLDKWNRVIKHARADRKLLGGILLDFANHKDQIGVAVSNDRVFFELQRALVDAAVSLVETGTLSLTALDVGGS